MDKIVCDECGSVLEVKGSPVAETRVRPCPKCNIRHTYDDGFEDGYAEGKSDMMSNCNNVCPLEEED